MALWRTRPDSSSLVRPEVMIRRLVPLDDVDRTIAFYEAAFGVPCSLRFDYPQAGLVLAGVGAALIIGGGEVALAPFRATEFTVLVADLDAARAQLHDLGAVVLEEPKAVPTGRNMLVRLPDSALVEYVEHRPGQGE